MSKYPFIVAEMGANHGKDLQVALDMVDAAAAAGADAIKIQTYQSDTMVHPKCTTVLERGVWAGRSLVDLYHEGAMPWTWTIKIFERAKERGILAFSSPFDPVAVTFLERHQCPIYKIASFEILDLELIEACAHTGKPLVISTGMATLKEIIDAVAAALVGYREAGVEDPEDKLTLLKCTSAYPAPAAEVNLLTMRNLRQHFQCRVGFSDHTEGIGVAIAAALEGADMIEKHLMLGQGLDSSFSLYPSEFGKMVREIRAAIDAYGEERFGPTPSEEPYVELRRTLHVVYDLKPGDTLSTHNLRPLRPGGGLAPAHLTSIVGHQVTRPVVAGEPLTWDMVRK